jgi:oxygen-dependent protoporphyrinogen oxidase
MEILLLEAGPRLGGTLGSEKLEGFILERGPNGFLDNVPDTVELVRELGLSQRLLGAAPGSKVRYIYKAGRLLPIPSSPPALLRSSLLTLRGRLRVLSEPLKGRGQEPEDSVATFGRRRLGDEATRTFLDPLVSGIFAGDVERLSLPAAFPRLAEMEARHGSLFRAMLHANRERKRLGGNRQVEPPPANDAEQSPRNLEDLPPSEVTSFKSTLYSFPGGLEEMVAALEARLGAAVRKSWPVFRVQSEGRGYAVVGPGGAREAADCLVLAVPAYRAAALLHSAASELSLSLEAIPYSPIAVVCLGFPREAVGHPLDGFGFLAPRDQGLRVLGSIWVSSIFPDHAPSGMVSLRCLIGGARDPDSIDLSDEALYALVLEELRPVLGLRDDPGLKRVYRYTKGIPQYNLGHIRRVEAIERHLWALPGLFLTGNAYRGVGINDCVREARRKARAVLEHLRR